MALLGRILVTGATGTVGRQVVAQAVEAGAEEVRAVVRDPGKATFPRSARRWALDHAGASR